MWNLQLHFGAPVGGKNVKLRTESTAAASTSGSGNRNTTSLKGPGDVTQAKRKGTKNLPASEQ